MPFLGRLAGIVLRCARGHRSVSACSGYYVTVRVGYRPETPRVPEDDYGPEPQRTPAPRRRRMPLPIIPRPPPASPPPFGFGGMLAAWQALRKHHSREVGPSPTPIGAEEPSSDPAISFIHTILRLFTSHTQHGASFRWAGRPGAWAGMCTRLDTRITLTSARYSYVQRKDTRT